MHWSLIWVINNFEIVIRNITKHFISEYDCPVLSDMFNLISWVSGGSITAAESIVRIVDNNKWKVDSLLWDEGE